MNDKEELSAGDEDPDVSGGSGTVDFGRLGDWTSWTSLLVLLLLAPLTILCLTPFLLLISWVLPGDYWLWLALYFVAFLVVFVPGLDFLQVWLVSRGSRKPTPHELTILTPAWEQVLSRVGKGKRDRFNFRVTDEPTINASAAGGNLMVVTTRALHGLYDDELEAVLAHEFGHHVGFHPVVLLLQYWMAKPFDWLGRLAARIHNLMVWLAGWELHPALNVCLAVFVLLIRFVLWLLKAILWIVSLIMVFLGRRCEYNADAVAVKLVYGRPLISALNEIATENRISLESQNLPVPSRSLWDTHPPIGHRIARIESLLAKQPGL